MTENKENAMFPLIWFCIIGETLTRCRHEKYTSFFILVQGKICFTSLYHDQFNQDLNRNKTYIMR